MVKSTLLENRMKAFLLRRSAFDTPLQLRSWIHKINVKAESYTRHPQINIQSLQRIKEDFIRSIQYFTGSRATISSLNTWRIKEYNRDVPVRRRLSASRSEPFLILLHKGYSDKLLWIDKKLDDKLFLIADFKNHWSSAPPGTAKEWTSELAQHIKWNFQWSQPEMRNRNLYTFHFTTTAPRSAFKLVCK